MAVNDNFANRTLLSGLAPNGSGSNIGATTELGEPVQSGITNSLWWSWIAPNDGTFTIDTKNSDFDTFLSVFTGSAVNNLTLKDFNDDEAPVTYPYTSLLTLNATAGTTYQIAVDGYQGSTGNIQLKIVPLVINGTPNADILTGSAYSETINGLASNDKIDGGAGDDTLNGNDGDDTLNGNDGSDRLDGGPGADRLTGGGLGKDTYIVDNVGDVVVELPDNSNNAIDLVESSITYTLPAEVESLTLTGSAGVHGTGNNLQNHIRGNFSNNVLNGSSGNDVLDGSNGNDALLGGPDSDILIGGPGSDQFVFTSSFPMAGVDTITDFNIFSGDKVILSKPIFSSLETVGGYPPTGGNPLIAGDFSVINVAATSEVAIAETSPNEIVYNRLTGSLFYNSNDNMPGFGATGGKFATIYDSPDDLTYTDFRVFMV
jgi:Ca2+-binding RTX toxin-like protein